MAVVVTLYDLAALYFDRQTMSDAYALALSNNPFLVISGTAIVVAHLMDRPRCLRRFDPMAAMARVVRGTFLRMSSHIKQLG